MEGGRRDQRKRDKMEGRRESVGGRTNGTVGEGGRKGLERTDETDREREEEGIRSDERKKERRRN